MPKFENPHREFSEWHEITYWKGGAACGVHHDWDKVEITPRGSQYPRFEFRPDHAEKITQTIYALQQAYERGRQSMARDVRGLLGVSDRNSL